MGSRDGVEEQDTVFVRSFYKAETKMTSRFRNGIDVSGSRNGTLKPDFCDYGLSSPPVNERKSSLTRAIEIFLYNFGLNFSP